MSFFEIFLKVMRILVIVKKEITIEGLCSFNSFLSLNNDENTFYLNKPDLYFYQFYKWDSP